MRVTDASNSSGIDAAIAVLIVFKKVLGRALFAVTMIIASHPVLAKNVVIYDQDIYIQLSDEVQNALNSGVTLNFVASSAKQQRFLIFRWPAKPLSQRFELSRHALSGQYILRSTLRPVPRSFTSLRLALDQIAADSKFLFDRDRERQTSLDRGVITIHRLALDIYALPTPMRLHAFWSEQWQLDSGWSTS